MKKLNKLHWRWILLPIFFELMQILVKFHGHCSILDCWSCSLLNCSVTCRRSIYMPKSACSRHSRLVIWKPPGKYSTMYDFSASCSHLGPWVTLHKTTAGQSVKTKVPMERRNRTDVYLMTSILRLFFTSSRCLEVQGILFGSISILK